MAVEYSQSPLSLTLHIPPKEGESLPKELIEELKKAFVDIEKNTIFPSLWSNGRKAD